MIRTYTDDGSEIANIGETQPSRGQMLRDVPLAIDERLRLGMGLPTAGDGQQSQCFDKDKDAGNFCLIAPTWRWILTSSATPDVFKECLGGSFVSEAFSGR